MGVHFYRALLLDVTATAEWRLGLLDLGMEVLVEKKSSAKPGTMMRVEVQVAEPLDTQLQFATVSEAKIKQSRLTVFPPHAAKLEGGTT